MWNAAGNKHMFTHKPAGNKWDNMSCFLVMFHTDKYVFQTCALLTYDVKFSQMCIHTCAFASTVYHAFACVCVCECTPVVQHKYEDMNPLYNTSMCTPAFLHFTFAYGKCMYLQGYGIYMRVCVDMM